jgi:hypothetical protein
MNGCGDRIGGIGYEDRREALVDSEAMIERLGARPRRRLAPSATACGRRFRMSPSSPMRAPM